LSDFEVRPEELAEVGARTRGLAQHVRELLAAVETDLTPSGLQTDAALAELLAEFHHGLGALSSFLTGHGAALDAAASGYAATERDVTDTTRRTEG
jgi:hypothetical protein